MIGRDTQLAQLREAIASLFSGDSMRSVLFVTGEAGIGKSTLLEALRVALETQAKPPVVSLAACSTPVAGQEIGGVEALEPWARIMASLVVAPSTSFAAGRIVGELAMAWIRVIPVVGDVLESALDTAKIVRRHSSDAHDRSNGAQSSASQQQMFQQYVNFLGEMSVKNPLVLMLDDAHWADASSANLLFAAARQLSGKPVAFVVAYRPDDAATSRGDAVHPILHVRSELERYDLAREIGVPTMIGSDIDALLNARYANYRNDDEFEDWLARISGGNALFITQFLATLEEDGYVDKSSGAIRKGFQSVSPPASASAVIDERVRRMPTDMRETLRYASVEGDTFTSLVLGRVTESPALKLLQRLRLIEESHALIQSLGRRRVYASEVNAWRFTHILVQKSLYDGLGDDERRLIHEMALEVLADEWQSALDNDVNVSGTAARIGAHAEVVGDYQRAATVLLEGARSSWRSYAESEAVRLLGDVERLVDLVADGATTTRIDALRLHGDIDYHRGRLASAHDRYEEAERLAVAMNDERRAIDAANGLALTAFWHAEYDDARSRAEKALEDSKRTGYSRGEVMATGTLGHALLALADGVGALNAFERSLEVARSGDGVSEYEASALNNIGKLQRELGNPEGARAAFEECLAVSIRIGDRVTEASALNNIGTLLTHLGIDDESLSYLERCLGVCSATGNNWTAAYANGNIGVLFDKQGDNDKALERYRIALDAVQGFGDVALEARLVGNIGNSFERLGDVVNGREHYRRSLALYESIGNLAGTAGACAILGDSLQAAGEYDEARAVAERALDLARKACTVETEAYARRILAIIEQHAADIVDEAERESHFALALAHAEAYAGIMRAIGSRHTDEAELLVQEIRASVKSSDEIRRE